ncbi:biotin--[acetyl-CoA-carboxylase] ligase [uncultured Ferrovibrio sp.]|jgi:BirA family biotin operon repressor/biotin-[acetyl-CoA-carboxylase] ligase|uniref:biotin--[acetyl-CoA-carboxylase] ligase n=1 Tax=uncultured Ferrovibrio sp. TaxID=1576913 RepID=UPI00260DC4CC|nr:biotin--[acetyl-CoA-carboxylase] ligase [uncultured Ferrovibrio sp.]
MTAWTLRAFDVLDSTNEEIRRQAEAGAAEGLAVLARRQTAGRGRRGRAWDSPEGNLFLSLLLRPRVSAAEAAKLSFLTAVALAETLELAAPDLASRIACKWPNDVLVNGAKIAGILLESRTGADAGLEWVVIGIGVNLAHHPAGTPYPVTDLSSQGTSVEPPVFAEWLLARFAYWHNRWQAEGFAPVRSAWLARAQGLGQPVVVRLPGGELHGCFAALDESGALLLDLPDGRRQAITAGDVFPVG